MSQAKDVELARLTAPMKDRNLLSIAARALSSRGTRTSFALVAIASGVVACGSGSHPPNTGPDGGGDASISGPDGGGGHGGNSAGGHAGTDGGGGAAHVSDDVPPTFNGISMIDALGEGSVRVSWEPAMDNVTAQGAMGYRIYRASKKGGEDFTRQRRCGDFLPDASTVEEAETPCYVVAVAGSTSAVVNDALPSEPFYYVARAVDAAGNEDSNTNEASAQTKDETAPIFGGVDSIKALSASSVEIAWGPAFDSTSPDPTLTYDVFLKQDAVPNADKDKPIFTSKPGEHTAVISKLDPLTTYHVIVRATDPAGNTDDNTYSLGVTTPEGVNPTFDGLKRVSADGNTVRLFWYPGSDNVTHPENIVYDVYSSLSAHREDFTKPPRATSAAGAASIVLDEANAATRYYYIVRARDVAGNSDDNSHELSISTGALPDTTPPTFNGAQAVTAAGPTSLAVTWSSAADDTSRASSDFTYEIFVSTTTPVSTKTPALAVRGALGATILGLQSATTYNVVVVALDAAGNPSGATSATSAKTADAVPADTTPPTLTGVPTVTAPTNGGTRRLDVTFNAATDDTSAPAAIRYDLCASTTKSDCTGSNFISHVALTTAPGINKGSVLNLDPRTSYFVAVRAEDAAGNLEPSDDHVTLASTHTSWTVNAQPILFNRCVSCHDYDDASAIIDVYTGFVQPPTETQTCVKPPDGNGGPYAGCPLKLIDRTRPEFSMIYRRVNPLGLTTPPFSPAVPNNYSGAREPRDTTEKLTAEEDDILLDWISQGGLTE